MPKALWRADDARTEKWLSLQACPRVIYQTGSHRDPVRSAREHIRCVLVRDMHAPCARHAHAGQPVGGLPGVAVIFKLTHIPVAIAQGDLPQQCRLGGDVPASKIADMAGHTARKNSWVRCYWQSLCYSLPACCLTASGHSLWAWCAWSSADESGVSQRAQHCITWSSALTDAL